MNSDGNSQIKKGALISYVGIIFNIVAGLLYTPWMVKQIGQSDYGLYALVSTFLVYFTIDFGLGQAIARFLAKYRAKHEYEKINQLLGLTTKLYLWISLVIMIALIIVYFFLGNIFVQLTPVELEKFKTIYIIAGLFSLVSFPFMPLNSILISYERFIVLKLSDIVSKIAVIICIVAALLFGYKLFAIVAINALVGVIVIVFKLIYLNKNTNIAINLRYKDNALSKELFGFSAWMTVIGIAQRLMINIAPTLLGIYSGTTAIAIFSIAMLVESYIWMFAGALNGLFLPKVASLTSDTQNRSSVMSLMIKVGRIQLFIIGLLFIGFLTLGHEFIILWMGESFKTSYQIAILLILPGFIILTQEIANTLLIVENQIKYKAFLFIGASLSSLIMSVFLIPHYGSLGAAFSISVSLILFEVIGMNIVFHTKMKLNIITYFKETFIKIGPVLILTSVLGLALHYLISNVDFITLILKASIISTFYLSLMWLIGLNIYEKNLVKSALLKVYYKNKI